MGGNSFRTRVGFEFEIETRGRTEQIETRMSRGWKWDGNRKRVHLASSLDHEMGWWRVGGEQKR